MSKITGLCNLPVFCPIVADFYSGMEVTVPLFKSQLLKGDMEAIKEIYKNAYNSSIVYYDDSTENGFISASLKQGKDSMQISVFGNEDRILLCARYDNLGKGASGAAVECLNIVLGQDKTKTLVL
jgi:N-acetyl-gamma-glutamyl-phosphate reductase